MKRSLSVLAFVLATATISAQAYEADAATMMRPDLTGTARSLGAGGAFSTVGADQSAITQNPAGIALYRSHEFSISGGALFGTTNTNYLGQSSSANFAKGTISQAGFIFASKNLAKKQRMSFNNPSRLDRVVFGIGFQKIADFNRNDYFFATNSKNSYAQSISNNLNTNPNNINLDNFNIQDVNAYQTYVSDYTDTTYSKLGSKIGLPVNQAARVSTKGSLNDINLTIGFNVSNTVYIGVGAGIPYMSYSRSMTFSESNQHGDSSYTSYINTSLSGVGINGRLGVIVKPVQWLRLGAAVQTPTYMRLNENDYGETSSSFGPDSSYYTSNGSIYSFNYYNPLKATFGASFYLKQWGFISVDYEMDDYTHTKFSFDGADRSLSDQENTLIAAKYKLASTVKAGAEFAYKSLRLRAGFAWAESPFRSGVAVGGYSGARFNYTAGIGYRGKRFFADLAYVRTQYKDYYTPYSYTDASGVQEPGVYNNASSNMIIATIGFKFGLNRN